MAHDYSPESAGQKVPDEVRESLLEEYFHKMRTGDDRGAMRILTLILVSSGPAGWIALG
jgi:hypothetical protein